MNDSEKKLLDEILLVLKKHPDFDIKSFKEEDYEKYKNLIPKKYQTYFANIKMSQL